MPKDIDSLKLCRSLRRIESKAHKLMTDQCNGETKATEEEQARQEQEFLNSVDELLNFRKQNIPVFLNGDPRGYTIKVEDDYVKKVRDKTNLYSDMGGFGIICPELTGD